MRSHLVLLDRKDFKLNRREICVANFLPPCEKAPPTFNQKSELRVTLKRGIYCNSIEVWEHQLLATLDFFTEEPQLFTETKKQF